MLDEAIYAAKEAGKVLSKYYGKVKINSKDEYFNAASLITDADIESEKIIADILKEKFPDHNIYGEEGTSINKGSSYTWVIDPLDGTSNFIRNIPLFGISIGLMKDKDPLLGVLYFPKLDLLFYAEKGKGAYCNEEKISVSKRGVSESLFYNGGVYKGKFSLEENVVSKVGLLKIIDCSSYELAQIAKGDAELYILESVLHDVLAGVVIIREAGGKVTDKQGNPWTPDSKTIIASNGTIHEDVLACYK